MIRADGSARLAVVVGDDAIASASAHVLASRGYRLVVAASDPTPVSQAIEAAGGNADGIDVDFDDPDAAAARVRDAVSGAVRVLVNAHFWVQAAGVAGLTAQDWNRSLRINLTGPLMMTQALLPALAAAGGAAVVHLGSVDGTFGNPHVAAYSAAKGGLVALTHVMAHEFAPQAIRVNCVARALVSGPDVPLENPAMQAIVAATPLGRAAEPGEVASVIAFLASDEARYVTGTVVAVDGGRTGITRGTA